MEGTPSNTKTLAESAAAYAAEGWAVFPIKAGNKQPLTPNGFKAATTDTAQVRAWWTQWPDANMGCVPGQTGHLVIDIDGPAGEAAARALGLFAAPTPTVTTGRGQHLWFKHPKTHMSNSSLAPGLDVRAYDGYVLLPPSVHPSGALYVWHHKGTEALPCPAAVLEKIGARKRIVAPPLPEHIPSGQRNTMLTSLAGSMRRRGASAAAILGALEIENSRCVPLLPAKQLEAIANSIGRCPPAPNTRSAGRTLVVKTLSEVQPEDVRWLWAARIPLGKLTVLDGDPGLGKSLVTLDLAARVSTGSPMPGETARGEPADVVLLTAEDGLADTVRRRLDAGVADVSRIHAIVGATEDELGVTFPLDLDALQAVVVKYNAKLTIIDPFMAFIDEGVNTRIDHDVRRLLAPLARLAEVTGTAVVVVRHLNKSAAGNAIYRGGGSIAFIGAARAGLLIARDPEDEQKRVLATTKMNLAKEPASLGFTIETVAGEPCVRWLGLSPHTANDLVSVSDDSQEAGDLKGFIRDLLTDAPHSFPEVRAACRTAGLGVSDRSLRRAGRALGVVAQRQGFGPGSAVKWSLPGHSGHIPDIPDSVHYGQYDLDTAVDSI